MANPEHLSILEQGVDAWNEWRKRNVWTIPDLGWADLSEANLSEMDLNSAYLTGTDFTRADLSNVDFSLAKLSRILFRSADLRAANLDHADVREGNFAATDLRQANFNGALLDLASFNSVELKDANFEGARLALTSFVNVDLRDAIGLETIVHAHRSFLDIDTIYRSNGRIPGEFLRDAGVPDDLIAYIDSFILDQPLQYYSAFISYAAEDEDAVKRLHADLRSNKVRCWYAPEDLRIGERMHQTVFDQIRVHDKLLLVLSEQSLNSTWVEDEVLKALEEEKRQQRQMLFPIRLDDAVMETDNAWAAKIRHQRHIGDFTRWKDHDAYQEAFDGLMRDLQQSASAD